MASVPTDLPGHELLSRGLQDLADVRSMLDGGLVDPSRARDLYEAIEADLYRYPAIDPPVFRRRVELALA